MRIFYCRTGWMKKYKGCVNNDRPVNGGKFNEENVGHEAYNFLSHESSYYGYVQSGKKGRISVENLGVSRKDESAQNVLVIWVSTRPLPSRGQFIVGWYRDATVYRTLQPVPEAAMSDRAMKTHSTYNIFSKYAVLLEENERNMQVSGMGHSNTWFGDEDRGGKINSKVLQYIETYENDQQAEIIETEKGLEQLKGLEREIVVKNRINQNKFRNRLLDRYPHCCLCQVDDPHFLRASHIKPWSESDEIERLDTDNGLLLCPDHDALFDSGYISFNDDGSIIISSRISEDNRTALKLDHSMKIKVDEGNIGYIRYHRENKFRSI